MSWVNLDDKMPEHPKNARLSDAAFRLHISGICYSNRHLTDGMIEADEVPRLARRFRSSALRELVDQQLWLYDELADAYRIHDYLDWNKSRAEVEEASERQRKRVMKRWAK